MIGATLCFLNSFVLRSQPSDSLCAFARLFVAVGPTMMYAAIITKTIRILVIFHAKNLLSNQASMDLAVACLKCARTTNLLQIMLHFHSLFFE